MATTKAAEKIGKIPRPIPPPTSLPDPGDGALDFVQERPEAEPDWNAPQREREDASYTQLAGPNGDFAVPTLAELGIKTPTTSHRGGETRALAALDAIIADEKYTATFEKPKTAPTAFSPPATTLLSPHLHFGSLSCRTFYWAVQDVVDRYAAGRASTPPTSLTGQLLFRDMYFGAQAPLGYKFAQTAGNGHCRFIPWHLPSVVDETTGLATGDYAVDSALADEWFRRWKHGRTGFPWIDALMRQLRREGWIHHLGRHAVACFLTRGGCYIDWMRGADVFEEWLIDHEVACNAGNWQWLSCTAFFAQFHRVYSPVVFPSKWDKEGVFVRKYVPELAAYPAKYIYEPWKCPIKDQKAAGCVVADYDEQQHGADDVLGSIADGRAVPSTYPKPLFDFAARRSVCLAGMKKAYDVGLHGNDARVLDGTWPSLFPDDGEGPTEGSSSLEAHFSVSVKDTARPGRSSDKANNIHARNSDDDDDDDGGDGGDGGEEKGEGDLPDRKRVKGVARSLRGNRSQDHDDQIRDSTAHDDDDDDFIEEVEDKDKGGDNHPGAAATATGQRHKRKRDTATMATRGSRSRTGATTTTTTDPTPVTTSDTNNTTTTHTTPMATSAISTPTATSTRTVSTPRTRQAQQQQQQQQQQTPGEARNDTTRSTQAQRGNSTTRSTSTQPQKVADTRSTQAQRSTKTTGSSTKTRRGTKDKSTATKQATLDGVVTSGRLR